MLLLLKVVLVPALVALASVLARRYGPALGGWLVGFPIVAGPILGFLTVEHGAAFGARAAFASALALTATVLFAIAYAWLARRMGWAVCLLLAYLVWFAVAALLRLLPSAPWLAATLPLAAVLLGPLALPRPAQVAPRHSAPRWDLPARMLATATLVLAITGLAERLGPQLSGLLTPLPCATTVLTLFTHVQDGPSALPDLFRGLFRGLISFIAFCTTVGLGVEALGVLAAFSSAVAVGLVGHGVVHLATARR